MAGTIRLQIEGMHCDGCVRRVTSALSKVAGVEVVSVVVGSATIHMAPGIAAESAAQAIQQIGFRAIVAPGA